MSKTKGNNTAARKLELKNSDTRKGDKILYLNFSGEPQHCPICSKELPNNGMVVRFNTIFYCGFSCTEALNA